VIEAVGSALDTTQWAPHEVFGTEGFDALAENSPEVPSDTYH
jgi:hypothetical protein